jgi:hypothetical protein
MLVVRNSYARNSLPSYVIRAYELQARRSRASERDSSGTTEAGAAREGDGADSPTRGGNAPEVRSAEAARPNSAY